MRYDQSWMSYGILGALQAAGISLVIAALLCVVLQWIGRRQGWGPGAPLAWSFLLAAILTAGGDLWDLFYFNYGRLQSLPLLRAKLATVHDPDSMGLRALCELLGVALGVYLGWLVWHLLSRRRGGDDNAPR